MCTCAHISARLHIFLLLGLVTQYLKYCTWPSCLPAFLPSYSPAFLTPGCSHIDNPVIKYTATFHVVNFDLDGSSLFVLLFDRLIGKRVIVPVHACMGTGGSQVIRYMDASHNNLSPKEHDINRHSHRETRQPARFNLIRNLSQVSNLGIPSMAIASICRIIGISYECDKTFTISHVYV